MSLYACRQRSRLCAVGELTNCLPGTEAKLITKSRSLELLPGRIPSAETKAWICTADDCFNVPPQLHKTFCCQQLFFQSISIVNPKLFKFYRLLLCQITANNSKVFTSQLV